MARSLKTFFKFRQASFNREFKSIYVECKDQFIRTFLTKYPGLNINDLEEIYDDSTLAFYNNVKENKLVELTCSLQTYINRIGENKIIDLFRKRRVMMESLPDYETMDFCERANEYWLVDDDDFERDRKNVVFGVVKKMGEPCRTILYSFYYKKFTMEMIAQMMNFPNSDVAKTNKSRCMSKVRRVSEIELRNKGII